jgi:hypothetical protein
MNEIKGIVVAYGFAIGGLGITQNIMPVRHILTPDRIQENARSNQTAELVRTPTTTNYFSDGFD